MKSITEILGQILLGISFNLQDTFEEYLTNGHRTFLSMLRVIEEHQPAVERIYKGRGRIPHEDAPMIRAFFAKSFFNIDTTAGLLERLKSDSSLHRICGFTHVPSAAPFSHRMKEFADHNIQEQPLYEIVREYHLKQIVGHISCDSTAIVHLRKTSKQKKGCGDPK